ncbi:DUF4142 domain-containing protein [Novosphingobium profundi]|uniref:DUF4142 domain-containing protein n=1 Tax=Novosphingobium profundi TaxID=1774954 RepID=UPI001BD9F681|nr:DUF4142 domain-containing protein [Novosphingobium profundi]MBT0670582.1 DUF4142 domain-containing protein [Novosphingobium profundi]
MVDSWKTSLEKVGDAFGGAAGKLRASIVTDAGEFIEKVSVGNRYEIEAANIALRRTPSNPVQAFAHDMISDHTRASEDLTAALTRSQDTAGLPTLQEDLDERHKAMLRHLDEAPQEEFESAYMDQQAVAHEETEALLRSYAERGDNATLKIFAAKTLEVVVEHIGRIDAIRTSNSS